MYLLIKFECTQQTPYRYTNKCELEISDISNLKSIIEKIDHILSQFGLEDIGSIKLLILNMQQNTMHGYNAQNALKHTKMQCETYFAFVKEYLQKKNTLFNINQHDQNKFDYSVELIGV